MNPDQFIKSVCKPNSNTIMSLQKMVQDAIDKKDNSVLGVKNTNRLTVYITDYTYTDKGLNLIFSASNPVKDFVGSIDGKLRYSINNEVAIDLPKVVLGIFEKIKPVEFLCTYKRFFFFKRPVICNIEATEEVVDKAQKENIIYNTGYSGNLNKQEADIERYAMRDKQKIDTKYVELLKMFKDKNIDFKNRLKLTKLNTISYDLSDGEVIHLTYSMMISKNDYDYKIIFDERDGDSTKEASKKYIDRNYDGIESASLKLMLDSII